MSYLIRLIFITCVIWGVGYIFWLVYRRYYYNSEDFNRLKASFRVLVQEYNDLNSHIENLRCRYLSTSAGTQGYATFSDKSINKYTRPEWSSKSDVNLGNIYECSRTICSNAKNQPFKYLCKYFDIDISEENLEFYESMLNDFLAVEQGKACLNERKNAVLISALNKVPFLIKSYDDRNFSTKLGFSDVKTTNTYFPRYTFLYVSAGGYSKLSTTILLDLNNLEQFINFLSNSLRVKKSAKYQRSLMTSALREKIKKRDNYTCKCCRVSLIDEPHLLLEIDHIIPISKGGVTSEDNLQTLCWKCNRSKGATL